MNKSPGNRTSMKQCPGLGVMFPEGLSQRRWGRWKMIAFYARHSSLDSWFSYGNGGRMCTVASVGCMTVGHSL